MQGSGYRGVGEVEGEQVQLIRDVVHNRGQRNDRWLKEGGDRMSDEEGEREGEERDPWFICSRSVACMWSLMACCCGPRLPSRTNPANKQRPPRKGGQSPRQLNQEGATGTEDDEIER